MSPVIGDAQRIKLGSGRVDRIYLGATRVWPPFIPPDIAGCVVWMDALRSFDHLTDGDRIGPTWENLIGTPHGAVQGTPQPIIRTGVNGRNGFPVIRFTPFEGSINEASTTGIDKDFTKFIVGRYYGPTYGRVFGTRTGNNILIGWHSSGIDNLYMGGWGAPDTRIAVNTNWRLYSVDGASASYTPRFFSNGVLLSTVPAGGLGWTGQYQIGVALGEPSNCEVGEVVFYNRKLTDTERQRVEAYLRQKWGF